MLHYETDNFSAKRYREARKDEAPGVIAGGATCERAAKAAGLSWSELLTKAKTAPVDQQLNISDLRLDGGTQPRISLSPATVAEYVEDVDALPPVSVFYDGTNYWLADGFHRVTAHQQAGRKLIASKVIQGTQRDAVLFSLSANANHGLRRTSADKRRAVETIMRDPEWSEQFDSDRAIARACHVSHFLVQTVRKEMNGTPKNKPAPAPAPAPAETPEETTTAEPAQAPTNPAPDTRDASPAPATSSAPAPSAAPAPAPTQAPATPGDDIASIRTTIAFMTQSWKDDVRKLTASIQTAETRADEMMPDTAAERLWNTIADNLGDLKAVVEKSIRDAHGDLPLEVCSACQADGPLGCRHCTAGYVTARYEAKRLAESGA